MNTDEDEGGILRDSVQRTLHLYYSFGHWRLTLPKGKEVNKIPDIKIPFATLKPFIRQLITEIKLWVGLRPYSNLDQLKEMILGLPTRFNEKAITLSISEQKPLIKTTNFDDVIQEILTEKSFMIFKCFEFNGLGISDYDNRCFKSNGI